jgi:hypothetical protein
MATHQSTQTTPPCHTRQIKIGSIMYDYRRKTKDNTQAIVPWLQLKGHWLARLYAQGHDRRQPRAATDVVMMR